MARISGVEIPKEKRTEIGLTYIYGIGRRSSNKILEKAGVNPNIKVKDLTETDISKITTVLEEYKIEGELRRDVNQSIKRLMDIGCYRGIRHRKGLPVRGQRTRTNARTRRGKRKTVGVMRKEVRQKMAPKEEKK